MAEKEQKSVEKKEMKETKETKVEVKEEIEKKEEQKVQQKKIEKPKKTEAIARGVSVRASKRHCMYICNFIKGKTVDVAISDLEQVIKLKKIIPFKGEIPHRKGKGVMSGRYPINASKIFILILKGLRGNLVVNGLDQDKAVVTEAFANWAPRPQRRGGNSAKRSHVTLIVKEPEAKK